MRSVRPWAPTVDDGYVWSMVMTPDASRVVVGGSFTSLNGKSAYGSGSLDAATAADALAEIAEPILGFKNGRRTFVRPSAQLCPPREGLGPA